MPLLAQEPVGGVATTAVRLSGRVQLQRGTAAMDAAQAALKLVTSLRPQNKLDMTMLLVAAKNDLNAAPCARILSTV
jgi:hypothetical protein